MIVMGKMPAAQWIPTFVGMTPAFAGMTVLWNLVPDNNHKSESQKSGVTTGFNNNQNKKEIRICHCRARPDNPGSLLSRQRRGLFYHLDPMVKP